MNSEVIARSALDAKSVIGKPLVVLIDGEKKRIGTITNAKIIGDGLFVASKLDQEVDDKP